VGTCRHEHQYGRIVVGQYVGFGAVLAAGVIGALSASLLPTSVIPYLGLLPIPSGLRLVWRAWREHRQGDDSGGDQTPVHQEGDQNKASPGVMTVAAVTFANGGDNIGVYVPVFFSLSASPSSPCTC
jgi:cadmium resistance protein CadD (predicted permease)